MRLLGRREHSARQLSQKLRAGGVEADVAGETVGSLAESGWQSDSRYAQMLVRSRSAQGYGPLRIEAEMRVAGIDAESIRAALAEAEVDWDELIQRLWQRKFGQVAENAQDRAQQYRYLAGRGFDGRSIGRVLKGDFGDDGAPE